ncbi:O-GlcNAc transferase [Roseiconus nitratireducens]|uniref:O-GlcNAc transferase n=1 Tax=Roseiconus nitratireducens TaxID=2605748 RepID=A0A5M6D9E6_9BACT|nr:O-GlcNAc transferase [Roseiconus nitratireducens]KAA5543256.1 O-GlcNAc transferase [Roseiconus nitratireducens]
MKSSPATSPELKSRSLGIGKKLLFAVVATAGFVVAIELLLAATMPSRQASLEDPYVGFAGSLPLLEEQQDSTGRGLVRFNRAKLVWFNNQSFLADKPPRTYRIVCLGGSTTFGRPFDDSTSFCGWLRHLLPMVDDERNWEVINAGGISYASYRVARVMQEFSPYEVDLFILYTGQNEFLEQRTYGDLMGPPTLTARISRFALATHLGRLASDLVERFETPQDDAASKTLLSGEVDEILNHTIGPVDYDRDDAWHRGVESHFRLNLHRMCDIASAAGARLVLVNPASNLRDCAPFKSSFDASLSEAETAALSEQLRQAKTALQVGDAEGGLQRLIPIAATDPRNAEVQFLLGNGLLAEEQPETALAAMQNAIDEDVCPLRATRPIKRILREVARRDDVIQVDFEKKLSDHVEAEIGHRCLGNESFLDHVHPSIEAHGLLARAIIAALVREHVVQRTPTTEEVGRAGRTIEGGIDRRAQTIAFRNLAKVMHWAGKFDEASRSARDALRLSPTDLESRFVLADSLANSGQEDAALDQYRTLFQTGTFDRALLPYGELLAERGENSAAKAYLMEAIFATQGQTQAHAFRSLGRLHERLGEDALAQECFDAAATIQSSPPSSAANRTAPPLVTP